MITWNYDNDSGRWVPLGPDGQPHRPACQGTVPDSSNTLRRGSGGGLSEDAVRTIIREELWTFGRAAGLLKEEPKPEPEPGDPDW